LSNTTSTSVSSLSTSISSLSASSTISVTTGSLIVTPSLISNANVTTYNTDLSGTTRIATIYEKISNATYTQGPPSIVTLDLSNNKSALFLCTSQITANYAVYFINMGNRNANYYNTNSGGINFANTVSLIYYNGGGTTYYGNSLYLSTGPNVNTGAGAGSGGTDISNTLYFNGGTPSLSSSANTRGLYPMIQQFSIIPNYCIFGGVTPSVNDCSRIVLSNVSYYN
jgi:hypothetical protein